MNYDPIHDTYVGNSLAVAADELAVGLPQRKALSISSLVSPSSIAAATSAEASTGPDITSILNDNLPEADFDLNGDDDAEDFDDDGDDDTRSARSSSKSEKQLLVSGRTVRHLKKADGEPFWRRDIQYDFLEALFEDETAVFTNSFPKSLIPTVNNNAKITFGELYVRTLAESTKCSRILKERLIRDKAMGKSVSKVCLLVNAGRMNTTINFVPEMRSSLRTYHSIPSLQADSATASSKPLQDTPRLKSILKAVCEGPELDNLKSIVDVLNHPRPQKPNTNVIKLVFLMSNYGRNLKFHYDDKDALYQSQFMEFFLEAQMHPKNRAKRFLWLLYTYLETDFTEEDLAKNPFGPGKIPDIEYVTDEELKEFDRDTDFEIEYSEKMYLARLNYLADEEHNSNPKRGNKSKRDREHMQQQIDHLVNPDTTGDEVITGMSFAGDEDTVAEKPEPEQIKVEPPIIEVTPEEVPEEKVVQKRPAAPIEEKAPRKRKPKRPSGPNSSENSQTSVGYLSDITADSKKRLRNNGYDAAAAKDDSASLTLRNGTTAAGERPEKTATGITFPIPNITSLSKQYTSSTPFVPLTSGSNTSLSALHTVINKSKPIIRQTKLAFKGTPDVFPNKIAALTEWIWKYFQYKKSTLNGLLGMEWEDIRFDLINGIESYSYQQLGKTLTAYKHYGLDSDLLRGPDYGLNDADTAYDDYDISGANGLGSFNGSDEIANFEDVGLGHLAIHDYNHFNEKSTFMLDLLSFVDEWLVDNNRPVKRSAVKFDLINETVTFS